MKIKMYMNVWKNVEPRFLCASTQCPTKSEGSTILSFDVDVPDYYLVNVEDHKIGPATNLEEVK